MVGAHALSINDRYFHRVLWLVPSPSVLHSSGLLSALAVSALPLKLFYLPPKRSRHLHGVLQRWR